jgi:hypothetical protein
MLDEKRIKEIAEKCWPENSGYTFQGMPALDRACVLKAITQALEESEASMADPKKSYHNETGLYHYDSGSMEFKWSDEYIEWLEKKLSPKPPEK